MPASLAREFADRARLYAHWDHALRARTRFFAAAALINQVLAESLVPRWSVWPWSGRTLSFMVKLSRELETFNRGVAHAVERLAVEGEALDHLIVRAEQAQVQRILAGQARADWQAYTRLLRDMDALLRSRTGRLMPHRDATQVLLRVLATLTAALGRPLEFACRSDRQAIGCALTRHLRR